MTIIHEGGPPDGSQVEVYDLASAKLLRSYVMEAEGRGREVKHVPYSKEAQAFLLEDHGRETIKVEPAAYRRSEIEGQNYDILAIEALGKFEDSGLLIHYSKMARD